MRARSCWRPLVQNQPPGYCFHHQTDAGIECAPAAARSGSCRRATGRRPRSRPRNGARAERGHVPEGAPAALPEVGAFEAFAAEAEPASGAEVGEHVDEQLLVPGIRAKERRGAHAAEHHPDVVVLIKRAGRLGRPGEQPVSGAVGRVGEETAAGIDPLHQVGGDERAAGVVADAGAQRKGERAFADGVGAEIINDGLAAQVIHFRAHALEDASFAIAARPGGIGSERLRPVRPGTVHQQPRLGIPIHAAHNGVPRRRRRQLRVPAEAGSHRRGPLQVGHLRAGSQPGEDHAPHDGPGIVRGIAPGDKLAEFGSRHQNVAPRMLEEHGIHVLVRQPEHGRVVAGHARQHQVRGFCLHRQKLAAFDNDGEGASGAAPGRKRRRPRPRAPGASCGTARFRVRQGRRILHVKAQVFLRRLSEHFRRDRRGLLRMALGRQEHAVARAGGSSRPASGVSKRLRAACLSGRNAERGHGYLQESQRF